MSAPLVSVVVPTWERLDYLRRAVDSVRGQTYRSWELVVVDDGSTDGTVDWVRGLSDPRIRLVALEHSGNLARVRNRGLAEARGELVAFMDSDDLFEPRKLELQVAALEERPGCGWSYSALTLIDGDGVEIAEAPARPEYALSGWILEDLLTFRALVDTPTVMARRELLESVGPLDEGLAECQDYDLFFRLAAASPAVALAEPLTRKRIHPGGMSRDRTRVNEAWVRVYDRFGRRSRDPSVRRLCARLAQEHRLGAASWRARRREPLRALAHVLAALRRRPAWPRAWKALVRDVVLWGLLGMGEAGSRRGGESEVRRRSGAHGGWPQQH